MDKTKKIGMRFEVTLDLFNQLKDFEIQHPHFKRYSWFVECIEKLIISGKNELKEKEEIKNEH